MQRERALTLGVAVLIAAKIAFLFAFAWHVRFVMDEFGQLGFAKYLGNGIFETVQPSKALGFAMFYKLAHWLGEDAVAILRIGRMQTALLACGILALVYATARALGEARLRALGIVLILLCFSNFAERSFRTIAEPLAVFFAAAALFMAVRGSSPSARRIIVAGVFSGLAFLATQKAAYFNLALGLALLADAALARRYLDGVRRGAWLVLGWLLPVAGYCFVFPGVDPLTVAHSLVFGPLEVATRGTDEYGGLRGYVVQTLVRNAVLYALCFAGLLLALSRIRTLASNRRIALVFTLVIAALVFLVHDQPWPYVFLMAQPFLALWALAPLDRFATTRARRLLTTAVLGFAVLASFARNADYLTRDNRDQLAIVALAERLVGPGETYFDGIDMLPNRAEPSDLWLDRKYVRLTREEGRASEAYRVFATQPPKVILWSYRMEAIEPVVGPLIAGSFTVVAPNIRLAGRHLRLGEPISFRVPIAGRYALYDRSGRPLAGEVEVADRPVSAPVSLARGNVSVQLLSGTNEAWLLPVGDYTGLLAPGPDNPDLFTGIYD